MSYLIPLAALPASSRNFSRSLKIHGTDKYLVSAELTVYLKWLIYVSAFKDHCNVDHLIFYNKEVAFKFWTISTTSNRQASLHCAECIVLDAWNAKFKPSKKCKAGPAVEHRQMKVLLMVTGTSAQPLMIFLTPWQTTSHHHLLVSPWQLPQPCFAGYMLQ